MDLVECSVTAAERGGEGILVPQLAARAPGVFHCFAFCSGIQLRIARTYR